MITCRFHGELGNNLFQLAALLGLAERGQYEFVLPRTRECYISNEERPLEIDEMFQYRYPWAPSNVMVINSKQIYECQDVFPEPQRYFGYTEIPLVDNLYLNGFFQSEKYFKHIANKIRDVYFKPKALTLHYINSKYGKLLSKPSVSIHVRRGGDRQRLQPNHKDLNMDYYVNALLNVYEHDASVAENIIIFSDDIPYCREIFDDDGNLTFIEGEKNFVDMFLMSKCTHNIVGNSTFSWWAAWMNTNANKIVVVPDKEWFGPALQHLNREDLFPEEWIKL